MLHYQLCETHKQKEANLQDFEPKIFTNGFGHLIIDYSLALFTLLSLLYYTWESQRENSYGLSTGDTGQVDLPGKHCLACGKPYENPAFCPVMTQMNITLSLKQFLSPPTSVFI